MTTDTQKSVSATLSFALNSKEDEKTTTNVMTLLFKQLTSPAFTSNNIPAASAAYGVNISKLVRYSKAWA